MAFLAPQSDFTNEVLMLTSIWRRMIVMDSPLATLFNVRTSQRSSERTRGVSSIPLPEPRTEGGILTVEPGTLGLTTYTHGEPSSILALDMNLVEDGEYGILTQDIAAFSESYRYQIAADMASVFNNAFNASYKVADGNALCSTARSTGLDNSATTALSYASLVNSYESMRLFKDANNLLLRCMPDTLIVPVQLFAEAVQLVNSPLIPGSDNNDVNFLNGRLTVIADPLLSDSGNWFLVDSLGARMHLNWFWRLMPQFIPASDNDFQSKFRLRGRMRYSYGSDNFTWIYGHNV